MNSHVKLVASALTVSASCFAPLANAEIIVQSVISSDGTSFNAVLDTTTSMQWLSLIATQRLSIATVLSGYGGWIPAGFRYATGSELATLVSDSGVSATADQIRESSGFFSTKAPDVAALIALITAIGWTYENNSPSQGYPFGQKTSYGILADIMYGDGQSPPSHYDAQIGANNISGYAVIDSGQWLYDNWDAHVGSFLVRNATSVPEPTSVALIFIALLSAGAACKQRRTAGAIQ